MKIMKRGKAIYDLVPIGRHRELLRYLVDGVLTQEHFCLVDMHYLESLGMFRQNISAMLRRLEELGLIYRPWGKVSWAKVYINRDYVRKVFHPKESELATTRDMSEL